MEALENVPGAPAVRSVVWVGDRPRKGLGVVSYGETSLRIHATYEPRHHWILPLVVEGPVPFTLFAVWTVPHLESRLYVHCLFEALETYGDLLRSPRVLWAGDFNNNFRLDKPRHALQFADFVARMSAVGLESLYHQQNGCARGEEKESTFFLYRKAKRPFHIDFIFASSEMRKHGFEMVIGKRGTWARRSDHMPLACSFRQERMPPL